MSGHTKFCDLNFLQPTFVWTQYLFGPKIVWSQKNVGPTISSSSNLWDQTLFGPKIVLTEQKFGGYLIKRCIGKFVKDMFVLI